jgi:hypothetical protein
MDWGLDCSLWMDFGVERGRSDLKWEGGVQLLIGCDSVL